jgi:hypothetical protein
MAELEQAFDGDPKMQAAILRVVDEQAARADAEAAKAIACFAAAARGNDGASTTQICWARTLEAATPADPSQTPATGRKTLLWNARNEGRIIGRTELQMTPMDMVRIALCGWLAFYGLLALGLWAMP